MTTWLLDRDLLVALRLEGHEHHRAAHTWFASLPADDAFATCAVTEGTLIRVHMTLAPDRRAAAAWTALEEIQAHPRHVFWEAGFSYADVPVTGIVGAKQVTDAWLAALARRNEGRLATLDAAVATLHDDVATLVPVLLNG